MKKNIAISCLIVIVMCSLCLAACNKNYICENTQVQSGKYLLDAQLVLPKNSEVSPVVLIVGGSGSTDMDGTMGSQKPYKRLAYALAEKGVATLRFNKTTFQYAKEVATDTKFDIDDEYFNAVYGCLELLKNDNRIDKSKIYLLGHSLGSQIIPVVLQNDTSLAGGIVMAGTTEHIIDLLMEQVGRQNSAQYNEYLPYSTYAKSLTSVPVGEENRYYFGAFSAYWVDYNNLDRLAIANLNCPLLIMQGELDLQVTPEHFEKYKTLLQGKSNVCFKQYKELNHLFSNGVGETVQTAYSKPSSIPQNVIDDIVAFIKSN